MRGERLIMYGLNKEQAKLAASFQIEDYTQLHRILKSCYEVSPAVHKKHLQKHQAPELLKKEVKLPHNKPENSSVEIS